MAFRILTTVGTAASALAALTISAAAHHPMGGTTPATFIEGALSGLGHPVIGLDHLAAILAVGCLAALHRAGAMQAIGYVLATMAGVAIYLQGATVPGTELMVAGSVIVLGVVLFRRRAWPAAAVVALFAIVGALHGYALGEAIVGAEPTPLAAYLAGLTLIQSAIALCAMLAMRTVLRLSQDRPAPLRIAGASIAAVGLALVIGQLMAAA